MCYFFIVRKLVMYNFYLDKLCIEYIVYLCIFFFEGKRKCFVNEVLEC